VPTSSPRLPALVRRAVREYRLWEPGEAVLVAVSGGPDSVALLAALAELPAGLRPALRAAAYLDHGLRSPGEARAERARAEEAAARAGVPFVAGARDVAANRSPGESLEAAARRCRYAFLAETARSLGCARVAVGHHRDDQVETVLMRLLRGAGLRGLRGMDPVAPLPGAAGCGGPPLAVVRPLLLASRADVLAYLTARGLAFAEDPTNRAPRFLRNRVRHELLPALEAAAGPGVRRAIWRTAENLRADAAALEWFAAEAARRRMAGDRLALGAEWEALPLPVRAAILRAWWSLVRSEPPPRRDVLLAAARLAPGGSVGLGAGLEAVREGEVLALRPSLAPGAERSELPVPGAVHLPGVGTVRAAFGPWPDPVLAQRLACRRVAVGDAGDVRPPLRLRPPAPGERWRLLGAPGRRRLRAVLAEAGIPRAWRQCPLVVEDAEGRPLWVVGARQAEGFRVGPATRRVLALWVEEDGRREGFGVS
jgi:tRNA(Ile)-lysidine synthase